MNLVYIASLNTSVFTSQVIYLLNHLAQTYPFEGVFLLVGVKSEKELKNFKRDLLLPQINVSFFKRYPDYPFFTVLNSRSVIRAKKKLRLDGNEKTVYHIRTDLLGYYFCRSLRMKLNSNEQVLVDIRGVLLEETLLYSKLTPWLKKLKISLCQKSHRVLSEMSGINFSAVSEDLKKHLINQYNYPEGKVSVNPCSYPSFFKFDEASRASIRKSLGLLDNEILVVFSSGGLSQWQNNEDIILLLSKIEGIKILNLSKHSIDIPNVFTRFVAVEEVPGYLSASDCAIILRDNNIVNNVASPVKFGEYISCGLPVAADNSVHQIATIIAAHNLGVLVNVNERLNYETFHTLMKLNRKSISEIAESILSMKVISKSYYDLYTSKKHQSVNRAN